MSFLNYDKPDMAGNNPYNLSRTTIDPRFKNSEKGLLSQDVKNVVGYSATGDVVTNGQESNISVPWSQDPCKDLQRYGYDCNIQRKIQEIKANQEKCVYYNAMALDNPSTKGHNGNNWSDVFMMNQVKDVNVNSDDTMSIHKLTDQCYKNIMKN